MTALYKYGNYIQQSQDIAFDTIKQPGDSAPWAGIYRCEGCGKNIGIAQGHTLPPQNHHAHTTTQGAIRWRLVVGHN